MPATRFHLVRHGEVHNPSGVVYGRLPGFMLSQRGREQAADAAEWLRASGADVRAVISSPLERTRESAAPFTEAFELPLSTDDDLLEATSKLENKAYDVSLAIVKHPQAWRYLVNPFQPSWGEPYKNVLVRMTRAIDRGIASVDGGDVVFVSHQMPIAVTVRAAAGKRLPHDPRKRRCGHSSVTSFRISDGQWTEIGYRPTAVA